MKAPDNKTAEYVGSGLTDKTYQDCLACGANPNENDPGKLADFPASSIAAHVARSKQWVNKALQPSTTA